MILGLKIGFLSLSFIDILDIALVTILLYQLYKLLKGSVAVKIFLGFMFIYLFYWVVRAMEMELLSSILGQFIGVGVIAAVVLFQQEIRKFLLIIGRTTDVGNEKLQRWMNWGKSQAPTENVDINVVVKAASELSTTYTGALIVIKGTESLLSFMETGDEIDALISKRLLLTIFTKNSPMHDGAVIIANGRIKAARCVLPVSENDDIPAQFGLRHRAAVGITEAADCVVLVVSEETGKISVVIDGQIQHDLDSAQTRNAIFDHLQETRNPEGEPNSPAKATNSEVSGS